MQRRRRLRGAGDASSPEMCQEVDASSEGPAPQDENQTTGEEGV